MNQVYHIAPIYYFTFVRIMGFSLRFVVLQIVFLTLTPACPKNVHDHTFLAVGKASTDF